MNRSKILLTCTLLTLNLAACVGPNFEEPKPSIDNQWVNSNASDKSINQLAPAVKWWESFNDPLLVSLIDRSMQSNLDLAQAQARVLQAKAARDAVSSTLWPSIDFGGQFHRNRTAIFSNANNNSNSTSLITNSYRLGLDASWEPDVFGGKRRSLEAADAEVVAATEQMRDVQISLFAEVATQYVSLRAFQQRLIVANENVDIQQKNADITNRRYKVGFSSILDVSNAEGQLATTKSNIPQLETSKRQAMYALSLLLAQQPGDLVKELETVKEIPSLPSAISIGLPTDLLKRRPDIRRAEALLHAETARVGVAQADFFPKFVLGAGIGVSGTDFDQLGNWSNNFWNLATSVTQPVFDAGRRSANLERQKQVLIEAFENYYQTVLRALNEVESTLVAYSQEHIRRAALEQAVTSNLKALKAATQLYTAGNTEFLNVLDSERSLYSTQEALTQSIQREDVFLIALYKALGGGWES